MPKPWPWFSGVLAATCISALMFLCTAEYARKETVRGWLVSSAGVIRVVHDVAAVVVEVVPRPGEWVEKGDPLIYLSADSALPNGADKNEHILAGLREEVLETEAQIELSREDELLEVQTLMRQLRQLDLEIASLISVSNAASSRVVTGRDRLKRLEGGVLNGAVTQWDLLSQQDDLSLLEQQQIRSEQVVIEKRRERELARGRLAAIPVQAKQRRSSLRMGSAQLSQRIAEHESRRLTVIRSPIAGVVAAIEASAGNSVAGRQLLMTLLPQDMELVAELYVPSRAAGFVGAGQPVRLLYDALPHQRFGTFTGRVERVADYVLLPAEIPQTFHYSEATYKVSVGVDDSVIHTSAGNVQLRPGMLLTAEIILESRNFIEWLLEPLRLRRRSNA